ncbi:MAG: carboxypeptidase-like regulatory domain-containing protein, partial [Saprospiraceae bacterium]|nr:carboxypeptidase-like regulatory domain-containing protein [Saprospiraceae bacterium]
MRKLILLHCLWLFGFLFPAFLDAQSSVQGKVTESSTAGEPLIGVNIYVKGDPGTGTTSDLDGRYELVVPAGAEILIFSYLGYEDREVPIEGRTTIDVALGQKAELLDEVIVSAFGVKREKKSIGYAAQNVSGDDLVNSRETNLVSAL